MIRSVTVVGGGTAGLISALFLRASFPQLKITLIESSKIGIIGVGEGSTEHWALFLKATGISVPDLIRETGATFKVGIRFDNWRGNGETYFHSLPAQHGGQDQYTGIYYTMMNLVGDDVDPINTAWHRSVNSEHPEPLDHVVSQYHFDTFKLNQYFHKLCSERNIKVVDDEITDVVLDEQGFINSLLGEKDSYTSEFFIDSTGFKRLLSSKLGAKWIDVSEQLPMNSALAFPTKRLEEIPSYTLSEAMSSGWRWRIPTQERFGNGYVFCDAFIDETKAFDEVQQKFNEPIEIGRKVKFSAGYVDQFLIKNCLSIGLAGMFVEPLEASSIGNTIQLIRAVAPVLSVWTRDSDSIVTKYNEIAREVAVNVVDFIQLHYITDRDDTEFWKWCKNNIKLTEFNQQYLKEFKENFVPYTPFSGNNYLMFTSLNYIQVMHGLGLFNTGKIKRELVKSYPHLLARVIIDARDVEQNEKLLTYYKHRDALEELKKRGLVWNYQ